MCTIGERMSKRHAVQASPKPNRVRPGRLLVLVGSPVPSCGATVQTRRFHSVRQKQRTHHDVVRSRPACRESRSVRQNADQTEMVLKAALNARPRSIKGLDRPGLALRQGTLRLRQVNCQVTIMKRQGATAVSRVGQIPSHRGAPVQSQNASWPGAQRNRSKRKNLERPVCVASGCQRREW